MRVELSSLRWTHGQPKSWTWTTWRYFIDGLMGCCSPWATRTLVGWAAYEIFIWFAGWEIVMALMANTSRLANDLDMRRHGNSWWVALIGGFILWWSCSIWFIEELRSGLVLILMHYGMHTFEHIYGVCLRGFTWWGRSSQDTLEFDGDAWWRFLGGIHLGMGWIYMT